MLRDPIIREKVISSVTPWRDADEAAEDVIKAFLSHILTAMDHVHRLETKVR
jgi:hypothetical protein